MAQTTPEITGSDANHIKRVVRLKPGDEIELFDGTGLIYTAQIVTVTPKKIQVTILQKIPAKTESRLEMVVAQAMLKEKVGPAWFMKGSVRVKGKVAVQVEFACALKEE